jgi:hypothetical protein
MTKDEALDLALEALEYIENNYMSLPKSGSKAITAIKQARSAPVQEPVAIVDEDGVIVVCNYKYKPGDKLYTTPPAKPAPVQEPVAWIHVMDNTEGIKANGKGIVSITQKRKHPFGKPGVDFSKSYPVTSTPLYTTPPAAQRQWVGLTDEEFEDIELGCRSTSSGKIEAMQKVEAKLKAKNFA